MLFRSDIIVRADAEVSGLFSAGGVENRAVDGQSSSVKIAPFLARQPTAVKTVEELLAVLFKNVIGVPQFSLPYLGYVSDFVQNPPGTYITMGIIAVLIVLAFIPEPAKKEEKTEESLEKAEKKSEENE